MPFSFNTIEEGECSGVNFAYFANVNPKTMEEKGTTFHEKFVMLVLAGIFIAIFLKILFF